MTLGLVVLALLWLSALTGWLVLERRRRPQGEQLRALLRQQLLERIAQGGPAGSGRERLRVRLLEKAARQAKASAPKEPR